MANNGHAGRPMGIESKPPGARVNIPNQGGVKPGGPEGKTS